MRLAIICAVIISSFVTISWGQNPRKGVIVPDSISMSPFSMERYTPTTNDVILAETIIKTDSMFRSKRSNLLNYRRYFRQYAGFYNDKGEKCIVINYTTDKQMWVTAGNKKWIYVLDGGNHFWQAIININRQALVDLHINGEA